VNTTWEGDSYVLVQQTSKFLLDGLQKLMNSKGIKHETLKFLTKEKRESPFSGRESFNHENLCLAIEYRANQYVMLSGMEFRKKMKTAGK
jgi:hypothetical protein